MKTETADAIRLFVPLRVRRAMLWRRSIEAKRDAALIFNAAAHGRPMELAKRLRLGKLAGGLEIKGAVVEKDGTKRMVLPLDAARLGAHDECVEVLKETLAEAEGTKALSAQPWRECWRQP